MTVCPHTYRGSTKDSNGNCITFDEKNGKLVKNYSDFSESDDSIIRKIMLSPNNWTFLGGCGNCEKVCSLEYKWRNK